MGFYNFFDGFTPIFPAYSPATIPIKTIEIKNGYISQQSRIKAKKKNRKKK